MIIALLALAFAMIGGGLLATFYGWDIVLVERGWTMVIAGSISAASGALLLGITAAVSKLGRIQAELARLQDESLREVPFVPHAATDGSLAALSGGLLGGEELSKTDAEADDKPEPLATFAPENRPHEEAEEPAEAKPIADVLPFPSGSAPAPAEEDASGARIPDFLRADRFRDTYAESRTSEADSSLYAAQPGPDEPEDERDAREDQDDLLKPAVWPERAPEPETELVAGPEEETTEDVADEEPARPAAIVGTYNSGDNKYVMYSDGAIEAQTPGGVFRFKSLEELKEFIAAGGEGNSAAST